MSISYEIKPLPTHIHVKGEGSYVLADAVQIIGEALAAAGAHRQPRILIDARNITGDLSTMQRFEFSEAVVQLYSCKPAGCAALIALVGNEPLLDPDRFGETVAVNRAVPVKVTTDIKEALDWLKIQSNPISEPWKGEARGEEPAVAAAGVARRSLGSRAKPV
jgi:hypothetical protein